MSRIRIDKSRGDARPPFRRGSRLALAGALAAWLSAGCGQVAAAPELRFEVTPPPNGVSGLVHDASETWTFGITDLCLTTPGSVTIREVALEPPGELTLVRFGAKPLGPDTDMGVGAVQEPMTGHGYRTSPDPVTISGSCPRGDSKEGTWSLAVEVKAAKPTVSGAITELAVTYGATEGNAAPRTFRIPMTMRLCVPGEVHSECGAS